jgi:hypothetical protein
MTKIKVLIFPYYKEIIIPVKKDISTRIKTVLSKLKQDWKIDIIDIPDVGYQGMILYFDNSDRIFVSEQNILYKSSNSVQSLYDPKKKVYNLLLKLTSKQYYKELNYFLKVKKYNLEITNKKFAVQKLKKID